MLKPWGWLRRFCTKAQQLGFEFQGYNGSGHPKFVHTASGTVLVTSLTPSDWRVERNTIADMERISGRKLPRDNAAHYSHKRVQRSNLCKTVNEIRACDEIDRLVSETESMRQRLQILTERNSRASAEEARRLVRKFEICRQELAHRHRHIDPLW